MDLQRNCNYSEPIIRYTETAMTKRRPRKNPHAREVEKNLDALTLEAQTMAQAILALALEINRAADAICDALDRMTIKRSE